MTTDRPQPPRVLSGPELQALVAEAWKLLEEMVARGVYREVAMRAFILAAVAGGAAGAVLDSPEELHAKLQGLISLDACKLMLGAVRELVRPAGRA